MMKDNNILELLNERKVYLNNLLKRKEKSIMNAPEGSLIINRNGKRTQFFHKKEELYSRGIYIKKQDSALVQSLAQKDYDKKIIQTCQEELKAIEKYLKLSPDIRAEQVYETLHEARQKLVVPIKVSDEQFIKAWEAIPYIGKGFKEKDPEFFSAKGERVRSKSEVMIADFLSREGIPYKYECPIELKGRGTIHPDFTILDVKNRKEIYLEHLGKMDDPGYAEYNLSRVTDYELNGIFPGDRLIITYETKANPLNQKVLKNKIKHYLS